MSNWKTVYQELDGLLSSKPSNIYRYGDIWYVGIHYDGAIWYKYGQSRRGFGLWISEAKVCPTYGAATKVATRRYGYSKRGVDADVAEVLVGRIASMNDG